MQTKNMVFCSLFATLFCICSWVSIPVADTMFTLQTLALFFSLRLLGGKMTACSLLVYLLLGAVGLPVFSGFRGGIAMLLGPTGGYLFGFLFCSLLYWLLPHKKHHGFQACIAGQLTIYFAGTAWYALVYAPAGNLQIVMILLKCVLPYLLPDALKLALGIFLAEKLRPVLSRHLPA